MHEPHEYALLFPLMEGDQYETFKRDIEEHGLMEPIILHEGKVLDGWNRERACDETGQTPHYEDYQGSDPLGFVITRNLHRRHMNTGQRAMVAVELEKIYAIDAANRMLAGKAPDPGPISAQGSEQESGKAAAQAAKDMNVGTTTVKDAKRLTEVDPELAEEVRKGKKTLGGATAAMRNQAYDEALEYQREHPTTPYVDLYERFRANGLTKRKAQEILHIVAKERGETVIPAFPPAAARKGGRNHRKPINEREEEEKKEEEEEQNTEPGASTTTNGHGRAVNWNGKSNPKREREVRKYKTTGSEGELRHVSLLISRLCTQLEGVDVSHFNHDITLMQLVSDVHDDLITLATWLDKSLLHLGGWLDDVKVREKIQKLRNTNGRTPEETETALRIADALERKLEARLGYGLSAVI